MIPNSPLPAFYFDIAVILASHHHTIFLDSVASGLSVYNSCFNASVAIITVSWYQGGEDLGTECEKL